MDGSIYSLGDDDYESGPFIVIFPAGVTTAPVIVMIINNNQLENNETFNLIIDSSLLPSNIISHPSQATVTIIDDDSKCTVVVVYVPCRIYAYI